MLSVPQNIVMNLNNVMPVDTNEWMIKAYDYYGQLNSWVQPWGPITWLPYGYVVRKSPYCTLLSGVGTKINLKNLIVCINCMPLIRAKGMFHYYDGSCYQKPIVGEHVSNMGGCDVHMHATIPSYVHVTLCLLTFWQWNWGRVSWSLGKLIHWEGENVMNCSVAWFSFFLYIFLTYFENGILV